MKSKTTSTPRKAPQNSSTLDVIIETPKGSRNKLKYEPENRKFKLSKIMPEGMMFPYDFGFVPSTKAEDGDPLDVLVLTDAPLFPGCLVECRLIGAIEAEQTQEGRTNRNDRLIAVAGPSLLYSEIENLQELNPQVLKQIEAFFVNYQGARGVEVEILGHSGPQKAHQLVNKASHKKEAA
ncbi:MAG: inorganic pyrophosphatase [Acidobacteria bacterium]|nr:MAG: inorganic pyrophosphatase [Acidobacteriota bacterium]